MNTKEADEIRDKLTRAYGGIIQDLQDKIRLLTFDNSENSKKICSLKSKLSNARETMKKAKEKLEEIRENGNYKELDKVISCLGRRNPEEETD